MADTVSVNWICPPDMQDWAWQDKSGNRRVVVQFTNLSDGTGETGVKKVDLSDLKTHNGNVPQRTVVEKIDYMTDGMAVRLYWDRAPDALIAYLPEDSMGCMDWSDAGGKVDPGLLDDTGDILLSTIGHAAGDTYDITMTLRLKD